MGWQGSSSFLCALPVSRCRSAAVKHLTGKVESRQIRGRTERKRITDRVGAGKNSHQMVLELVDIIPYGMQCLVLSIPAFPLPAENY